MRQYTDSAVTINYPDSLTFSGDLNKITVTKNTTATHFELTFIINGYTYNENLYFYSNTIEFSMSDILKLIFDREQNATFVTCKSFDFTIKLYNNTSLIDTVYLTLETVILGQRRVFDEKGVVPNINVIDYDTSIQLNNKFYYYFSKYSNVYAVLTDSSQVFVGIYEGFAEVDLTGVVGTIDHINYNVNLITNPNFEYRDGTSTTQLFNFPEHPSCNSYFGITNANKLVFNISDVSCGDNFTLEYLGNNLISATQYTVIVKVSAVNNPSGNPQTIQFKIGSNYSATFSGVGTFSANMIAPFNAPLEIIGYMDADTGGFGAHGFICDYVIVKLRHSESETITLNTDCGGYGEKMSLRFLNRFGKWCNYYVTKKSENIAGQSGISLFYLEGNDSEINGVYTEEKKGRSQAITVFRDGLTKEIYNDFTDLVDSEYVHYYDNVNEIWLPCKVLTNSFAINERENLFDVSLNLLLQS